MTTRQLYIDGRASGPSHGRAIPGPFLPSAERYVEEAWIEDGDGVVSEVRKTRGREQIRVREADTGRLGTWRWRDSIREEVYPDAVIRTAERVRDGRRDVLG